MEWMGHQEKGREGEKGKHDVNCKIYQARETVSTLTCVALVGRHESAHDNHS